MSRFLTFDKRPDPWALIPDTWSVAHGTWHLTLGTWHQTADPWHLEPDTWDLAPGTCTPETWNLAPHTWNLRTCHLHFEHSVFFTFVEKRQPNKYCLYHFPKIHRNVLRKTTIDLLYFWDVYDVNLWEKKFCRSTAYSAEQIFLYNFIVLRKNNRHNWRWIKSSKTF